MPEIPKHPAHWCAIDHEPIWHSDGENELCPLCRRIAEISRLREQVEQRITVEQAMEVVKEWMVGNLHTFRDNEGMERWVKSGPTDNSTMGSDLRTRLSKLTQR